MGGKWPDPRRLDTHSISNPSDALFPHYSLCLSLMTANGKEPNAWSMRTGGYRGRRSLKFAWLEGKWLFPSQRETFSTVIITAVIIAIISFFIVFALFVSFIIIITIIMYKLLMGITASHHYVNALWGKQSCIFAANAGTGFLFAGCHLNCWTGLCFRVWFQNSLKMDTPDSCMAKDHSMTKWLKHYDYTL